MAVSRQIGGARPRAIPCLRWWIGGILFASTVINYIDRQTLSILAPFLKQEYHWSNTDYANIADNVSDFLVNKERGLEQFYEIVRQGTVR